MNSIKPIFKQEELVAVCAEIEKRGRFALDLEFIPEKTFNPVLALLQVATDESVYIIDPLSTVQLNLLWQKVADKRIMKVLHAAKEDLNIIRQISNLTPRNIFDTQIAAGFLGHGYPVGYKKLLAQMLNVQINKSESFTDWLMRPLSELQLRYAYEDVCHLLPLADKLMAMLKEKQRLDWVCNECAAFFCQENLTDIRDYGYTRIKGARSLAPQKLAVLQALCELRIEEAKRTNKPLKAILSDITLLELSRKIPSSVEDFNEMRGINIEQAKRQGKQIIAAIQKALALPQANWPSWPGAEMITDAEGLSGDVLYAILKVEAYELEIAPELLATRNDVQKLITNCRHDCHEDKELAVLKDWRYELIGKKLLSILDGAQVRVELDLKKEIPVKVSL